MPITLTFDTPEELQAFFQQGSLEGAVVKKSRGRKKAAAKPVAAKPGRPGRKKAAVKPVAKKATAGRKAVVGKKAATPKKAVAKSSALKTKKVSAPKAAAAPKKAKTNGKSTLTGKIKETIQRFLDNKKSFTANDIYDDMAKRDKGINKQSVITSVLKQMNSTFSSVSVTERPGAGPRPVKLYNA